MTNMDAGMNKAFPDARVAQEEYEPLIGSMTCEGKDRHILAVAVVRKVDYHVTANDKVFRLESVKPYDIEVCSPDQRTVCSESHRL